MGIPVVVVLIGVLVATVTDVRKFKVYNALTLPMLGLGLVYHLATEGMSGVLFSLLGALAGFTALLLLFLLGAVGAGDVKLAAAVGAWLGTAWLAPVLVIALLATAVYSGVLLAVQKRLRDAWLNFQVTFFQLATLGRHFFAVENCEVIPEAVKRSDRRQRLVPFSLMLGIGVGVSILAQFLGWFSW